MRHPALLLLGCGLGLVVVVGLLQLLRRQPSVPAPPSVPLVRAPEAVAALGQLEPAGDVRRLAAPISGFGGTPRVAQLLVSEGERLRKGQVLARFDNRPQLQADFDRVKARLLTLAASIRIQARDVQRYSKAAQVGAASLAIVDEKRDALLRLQGEQQQAEAEQRKLLADLANSELRSPLDGVVLRIHAREGERPGADGVIEVGANQAMEAEVEVYESDINRVRLDQEVALISENGGFQGTLSGFVIAISPQVRQRRVLSTDPTGDVDARIVEVRVKLDAQSAQRVRSLAGMKVIARFRAQ
ncbi:MAG: HlyD family efflux transporter periplasmic adaptor subunit [Synechococcus sp.]